MAWHYAIPGKILHSGRTSAFTWPKIEDPGGNVKIIDEGPHWQWIQCVLQPEQFPIKTKTLFEKGGIQILERGYETNQYVSAILLHSTKRTHIMCAYRNEMDISPPELKHFTVIDDIYPDKRDSLDKLVENDDTLKTCFLLITRGNHLAEAIFTGIPTVPKNDKWRCLSASCLVMLMRMPLEIWDILSRINNQVSIAGWLKKTVFLKQCLDIYDRAKSERKHNHDPLSFKITYNNVEQANKLLCGVFPDNKDGSAVDADACITSISTELKSLSELANIVKFELPLTDSHTEFLCPKKTLYDLTYNWQIDEKINCSQPLGLIYTDSSPHPLIDPMDALSMGFSDLALGDNGGFHKF